MDTKTFVEQLGAANQDILDRLAPAETLVAESGGDLRLENLLKIALKNELEATELAARGHHLIVTARRERHEPARVRPAKPVAD